MKILAIQNRKGIGDMVIFLPFIEAISKKFDSPVSILVKENSKAEVILSGNKNISNIIILDRDNSSHGRHDGFIGSIKLISDIKKYNFEKVFIFNSSLRYTVVSKLAKIKKIYQYKLFNKKNQNIIETAKKFLMQNLNIEVESNPLISINSDDILKSKKKYFINDNEINILLGVGGSGPTKRVSPEKFIELMNFCSNQFKCKFFIAAGPNEIEEKIIKQILNSGHKERCIALNKLKISETLPIIKNCNISVCNDTSFSHLSAALGIETIVLMTDTPLLYGNYSPRMHPILPDGEKTVTHDTLGKDKISPKKVFDKIRNILKLN